jgi:hypothetical protein
MFNNLVAPSNTLKSPFRIENTFWILLARRETKYGV